MNIILELLWVAPELIPLTVIPGTPATQKGDVYSFAIILEEIIVRGGPFEAARQFLDPQGNLRNATFLFECCFFVFFQRLLVVLLEEKVRRLDRRLEEETAQMT